MSGELVLTAEEKRAVASLRRLAKRWPNSLWIFATGGDLHVMQKGAEGRRYVEGGGADPQALVAVVPIECDGGDW